MTMLAGPPVGLPLSSMSPLRYPGAKRKLLPALASLLAAHPRPSLFVEPFCGGASVALGLLHLDLVDRVLLADRDPLVAAFWDQACRFGPRLVEDMMGEPVTVQRWDHWRQSSPTTARELALKCLFPNRTSFSGIIANRAGPIGGRAQSSATRIGCRFNKDAIAERILTVHELSRQGRIQVRECSWPQAIPDPGARDVLLYLDLSRAGSWG